MVESIDPLFKGTNFSTEVEISNNNPNYTIENNVLYNKDKTKVIECTKIYNRLKYQKE